MELERLLFMWTSISEYADRSRYCTCWFRFGGFNPHCAGSFYRATR